MKYLIKRDGKYISELFPVKFGATNPDNAIPWSNRTIAADIAAHHRAYVEEIKE